jgi:hypothetical protein
MENNYTKLIVSGNIIEYYQYEKRTTERGFIRTGLAGHKRQELSDNKRLARRQDNDYRAMVAFGRLCSSNFNSSEVAVFCTFTFKTEQTLSNGYRLFNLFTKRLRFRTKLNYRFIAVPEFGTSNTKRLHFHALFWGFDLEQVRREREARYFSKIWKYGFIDMVITDNSEKIGFYLGKYLRKARFDVRLSNHKAYVCSKNIIRPSIYTSFVPLFLEYVYGVDNLVLKYSKQYDTLWLGRCDYKLYNLE